MSDETWVEKAEDFMLFGQHDDGGDISKLLEMTPTNRTIAGKEQAVILANLRFRANYFTRVSPGYEYLNIVCDIVEGYQLTMDGEQNSRRQFMKASIGRAINKLMGKNNKSEDILKE